MRYTDERLLSVEMKVSHYLILPLNSLYYYHNGILYVIITTRTIYLPFYCLDDIELKLPNK